MRIALLQYPIVWADKATNLRLTVQRLSALVGKADMALLPEMFSTGFCTSNPELAEPFDGPTITQLQSVVNETQIAVVSSFICRENNHLYNRGFMLRPNDRPLWIDKAHLYKHGGEDKFFTPGNKRNVFEYLGVKFRLLLCYDLRFPVWARQDKSSLYDILLVSANWPEIRIAYWDALIAARATENQCYICAVNLVGDDGLGLHYNGHSIAYDTHLNPLACYADNEEGSAIANFDIPQLHHFRKTLPLWQDGDSFTIH